MQVYILNTDYEIIGYIDEADSIIWHKKFNELGECEIYLPCDVGMLGMLQKGYYIFRYDDDMFCKIESVTIDTSKEQGDYIIAVGTDISTLLSGRIVRWQTAFSGTVANFIKMLIEANVTSPKLEDGTEHTSRKIANFVFDDSNLSEFTDTIETSVHTDDLLQLIISTCKAYNYGFRTYYIPETKTLKLRLFKGIDRATSTTDDYVEFSPEYGNIISSKYSTDDRSYKNIAYVSYKTTNDEVHLYSVTKDGEAEPQGEARREIFIDGTGTSRSITLEELKQMFLDVEKKADGYYVGDIQVATSEGSGEDEKITVTDYTYLLLIRAIGKNALAENTRTDEFTGAVDMIDSYRYKTDYNIGDVVMVRNDYGISAIAQITEIIESQDNDDGYVIEPRFQFVN
jgi:hypothetical protein